MGCRRGRRAGAGSNRPGQLRPGWDRLRRAGQDSRSRTPRPVCAGTQPPRPRTVAASRRPASYDRAGAPGLPRRRTRCSRQPNRNYARQQKSRNELPYHHGRSPDDDPSAPEHHYTAGSSGRPRDVGEPAAGLSRRFHRGHRCGPEPSLAVVQQLEVVEHIDIDLDINVYGNRLGSLDVPDRPLRRRVPTRRSPTTSRKTTSRRRRSPTAHRARRRSTSQFPRAGYGFLTGADAQYGGIVFNAPTDPDDPPKIIARSREADGQCRYRQAADRRTRWG